MKTVTIKINKKSVMGVVEALSTAIAQHNPEVDFQAIWASDSEEAKLDIYYREAITDLENFLARFSSSTTQQFDLQALADDFTITIKTLAYWPSRLTGVLTNQIQNYLVHAITAGWLNDFPEMAHSDYASMGANDLDAIKEILLKKDFIFDEAERNVERASKEENTLQTGARALDGTSKERQNTSAGARGTDGTSKEQQNTSAGARAKDSSSKDRNTLDVEARGADASNKEQNTLATDERGADGASKETNALNAEARGEDTSTKERNALATEERHEDGEEKDGRRGVEASERNQDFMSQHFHQDFVDWSGGWPPYELR